jgi:hypothetical protein
MTFRFAARCTTHGATEETEETEETPGPEETAEPEEAPNTR